MVDGVHKSSQEALETGQSWKKPEEVAGNAVRKVEISDFSPIESSFPNIENSF